MHCMTLNHLSFMSRHLTSGERLPRVARGKCVSLGGWVVRQPWRTSCGHGAL